MKELLLDLETYATTYNAAIAQIGVALVDTETGNILDKKIMNIDPSSEFIDGYNIDDATLVWWQSLPKEIQDGLLENQICITDAMNEINTFINGYNDAFDLKIWCNKSFDTNVVSNACKIEKIFSKWLNKFTDLNTLWYISGESVYIKTHNINTDITFLANKIHNAYKRLNKG